MFCPNVLGKYKQSPATWHMAHGTVFAVFLPKGARDGGGDGGGDGGDGDA